MPSTPRVTSSASATSSSRLADAAKRWAEGFNFTSSAAKRLQIARTKAPATGPESLQRTLALYNTFNHHAEVKLLRVPVNQQTVWAIHAQTDGDAGYLELFSDRGKLLASGTTQVGINVAWDTELGAVREQIAPRDITPAVAAFHDAVDGAARAGTASGEKIAARELRESAKILVGKELTGNSVEHVERAALYRVLAGEPARLTAGARDFGTKLAELYLFRLAPKLTRLVERPASEVFGGDSAFIAESKIASAGVQGRAQGPKIESFKVLCGPWQVGPTQVVPATRAEAIEVLKSAGASSSEARAIAEHLAGDGAQLFTGQMMSYPPGRNQPRVEGQVVFASTEDGKKVSAFFHPHVVEPPAAPREAIARLTGVDREAEIVSIETIAGGQRFELQWRPPWGVAPIQARVTVPNDPAIEPSVDRVRIPVVLSESMKQVFQNDLLAVHGPTEVLGWVGRDGEGGPGPGFVVVHRPEGQVHPTTISKVKLGINERGERFATVTPMTLIARERGLAEDLAVQLLRSEANKAVAGEPNDPLKFGVAMRTAWLEAGDLTRITTAADSPVGFNPRTDLFQFELTRAVGDAPMHVTFAKDGTLRVDGP